MFHNEISGIILNHVKSDVVEYSISMIMVLYYKYLPIINNYANFVVRFILILQYRVPW